MYKINGNTNMNISNDINRLREIHRRITDSGEDVKRSLGSELPREVEHQYNLNKEWREQLLSLIDKLSK